MWKGHVKEANGKVVMNVIKRDKNFEITHDGPAICGDATITGKVDVKTSPARPMTIPGKTS